ncbi:MAG: hypothetical protein AAGH40_14490 [Verrucomicrobiota bacterium]
MSSIPKKAPARPPFVSIGLVTAVFVGVYFVLRALPDAECGFLYYEEIVNADGQVEFCATNHAGFLDLTRLEYPVKMGIDSELDSGTGIKEVKLDLETKGGMSIAPHELAVTHTEKMHVMLIDPSLEDYHHVHPQPDGIDGEYRFDFKPRKAGDYQVFTEIVPLRTKRQVIATGKIQVEGAANEARFSRQTASEADGLRFELGGAPETLRRGRDYKLDLDIFNADGSKAELESIMGAKGHMVAFDAEKTGFAHMHPIDSVLGESQSDELAFLFNVPNSGWYRLFAQVQVQGREVFGRFDLYVE